MTEIDATSYSGDRHRALWAAVVLQAREDVECAPIGSTIYDQACAFFVAGGIWSDSRRVIADHLGLHEREIRAAGKRWIAARRIQAGLPEVEAPRPSAPKRRPPAADVPPRSTRPKPPPHERGHVRADNPFAVYRLRPR